MQPKGSRTVTLMRLNLYSSGSFSRGASQLKEAFWLLLGAPLLRSAIPGAKWRVSLLRAFGAQIGDGVVIKPHVSVKFPWRLEIGSHCWIGERVWIDNLAPVQLGKHVCISQGGYLCTGSHDWSAERFDLIVRPIYVGSCVWVGARASLAPGTHVGEGCVLTLGSVASGRLEPWTIWSGVPARAVKVREMKSNS